MSNFIYIYIYIYTHTHTHITTTDSRCIFWVVFPTFPPLALPHSMRYKITRNDKGGGGNNKHTHHSDTNKI
jgi:hypothetical protein